MDIPCPKCGESIEVDLLTDTAEQHGGPWEEHFARFLEIGCSALSLSCQDPPDLAAAETAQSLYDALGDDVDAVSVAWESQGEDDFA